MKINVKYIDSNKYKVLIHQDDYSECPNEWGCFEVKIFNSGYHGDLNNCKMNEFYDENDNLNIGMRSRIKHGTAFPVGVRHYSNTDGGFYSLADIEDADGFILFDKEYIKGESFERRREYAKGDLNTYQEWANGEVYIVSIEDMRGEVIDSLGGLYGTEGIKQFIEETIPGAEYEAFNVYPGTSQQLTEAYL
jgi:hypothetical protein